MAQQTLVSDNIDEPNNITVVHNEGYCAMYGTGGKISFFGPEIPKPNNIKAQKLSTDEKNLLVDICGNGWLDIDYACCNSNQLDQLKSNLAKADALIASCPACRENFYQLFCHFTCSPNQSTFIDIVSVQNSLSKIPIVDEVNVYINSTSFASPFYDSCKNIKFGLTNGYAMDLIGGGASNYSQFLKFLGDKKPQIGGSPFQINYKYDLPKSDNLNSNLSFFDTEVRNCNDSDPKFACACSDCPQVCPILSDLPNNNNNCTTYLGMSCLSYDILISYFILLISFFSILSYIRFKRNKDQKKQLLIDDNDIFQSSSPELAELSFTSHETINLLSLQQRKSYIINNYLESVFYKLGFFCSTHPKFVLTLTSLIIVVLSSFTYFIQFEKNPIHLWVSPNADAYIQKEIFDESFGPFYRTQQIIISNTTGESILQDYDLIKWWFYKEQQITALSVDVKINNTLYPINYDDICFKPLGDTCVLESFTQYFDGDINQLPESTWKQKLSSCARSPVECLPSFQQPLKKSLLFGGNTNEDILTSKAIVVTLLNNNDNDDNSDQVIKASNWEKNLEDFILNNITIEAKQLGLDVSFMTEISLEQELNKSTNTDIRIVIISYLIMFAYASFALTVSQNSNSLIDVSFVTPFGKISGNNPVLRYLAKTKFTLGLIGILIVLISVFSSMGFWSLLGLKSTLIIAEVIPFLILAVGVDNIFLICNEFSNVEKLTITSRLNLNEKLAKTMANIGPSILLSSSCQFLCFILGSFVGMPAVKNFSLYISVAIIFNTALQITAFISIFTLDQQRISNGKLDLLPFITIENNSVSLPSNSPDIETSSSTNSLPQMLDENNDSNDGLIKSFFKNQFGPFIFKPEIRGLILIIVAAIFGISLSLIPNLQLGLDQRIALPSDSYLIDYFDDIYNYLNVGPPIYFVVEDMDFTNKTNQQKLCGKFTTCDSFSLVNILEQEYKRSNESTIAEPISSWLDDFLMWLNPELTDCCRVKKTTGDFCNPFDSPRACETCFENRKWNFQMEGFPEGEEFIKFFNEWIESDSYPCPLGGKAPYTSSILIKNNTIERTAFRTSHIPLKSQNDFIKAYHNSLRIVEEVGKEYQDIEIFAYSPFYIFFVQYESIRILTFTLLSLGLLLVGFISMMFLGSLRNSILFVINLILIIVSIIGWMVFSEISLNAVSLVNLLICLGLSVEFSVHLFKHFNYNKNQNNKLDRALESLVFIGTTTLGGITLTKLIGIGVLSFTRSKIFRVYYFQMWAGLVIIASVHALIVAPVLLGMFGSDRVYGKSAASNIECDDLVRRLRDSM